MKKFQTQLRSLTLDSPAWRGCVCIGRKTTRRKLLTSEKLTEPVSTAVHWHSTFTQAPFPAVLRMIQSP
jgi:hypothetical protein